jgi:hypothetical protein
MNPLRTRVVFALLIIFGACSMQSSRVLAAAPEGALAEMVQPGSSPLAKLQLVGRSGGSTVFLQPQVSGFIVKGGFFVTVAHPYDEALIRKLKAGTLTAYAKFPLFTPSFFEVGTNEFPDDVFYVDESRTLYKNHTYFVRLAFQTVDYENDFSIWTFNPKIAPKLPGMTLATQKTFSFMDDYYLLQSADPQNSTGYLISPVKLDGLMYQHSESLSPVSYSAPGGAAVFQSSVKCLLLGERLVFNGYFKFGTSGSPFLNKDLEVIGMQSSALYTQYKYAEYLNTTQGVTQVQYQGNIYNRCVAIRTEKIREALARIEARANSQP